MTVLGHLQPPTRDDVFFSKKPIMLGFLQLQSDTNKISLFQGSKLFSVGSFTDCAQEKLGGKIAIGEHIREAQNGRCFELLEVAVSQKKGTPI